MILRLIREQLRSQWRFTAWTAGLLALGLALATFAMVRTATQIAPLDGLRDTAIYSRDYTMEVYSFPTDEPLPEDAENLPVVLPFETLDPMLDRAAREGDVTILREFSDEFLFDGYALYVWAFMTPVPWSEYLVEGRAPERGETVLNVEYAALGGWTIGDTVEFGVAPGGQGTTMTLEVVGLSRSGNGTYRAAVPGAFLSWDDSVTAASAMPQAIYMDPSTGVLTFPSVTTIAWDGDNAALPIDGPGVYGDGSRGFSFGESGIFQSNETTVPLVLSALAVVGVLIAGFAMGRAQAEARTRWVATARVLGATRRAIAASSILEAGLVGAAAAVVGLGVGYLVAALELLLLHARTPQAMLPDAVSLPAPVVSVGLIVGIGVAAVVAAVPAFLASRVSPVAALGPVAPATEHTAPRRVWLLWILIPTVIVVLDELVDLLSGEGPSMDRFASIAAAVAGSALVARALPRLLRLIGARLARRTQPWAIAAGDGLVTHARMYTYASLSMVVVVGAFSSILTHSALNAIDWSRYRGWGEPPMKPFGAGALQSSGEFLILLAASLLTATGVALAMTLSSERAGAADAATRAALGMSHRDGRAASGVRLVIPLVLGATVGGLLGWLLSLIVRILKAAFDSTLLVNSVGWNVRVAAEGLLSTAVVVLVALAFSLAGALVVARWARERTPVEALRPAGKVRAR